MIKNRDRTHRQSTAQPYRGGSRVGYLISVVRTSVKGQSTIYFWMNWRVNRRNSSKSCALGRSPCQGPIEPRQVKDSVATVKPNSSNILRSCGTGESLSAHDPKHTIFFTFLGSSVRANSFTRPFTFARKRPAPMKSKSISSVNGVSTLSALTPNTSLTA